MKLVNTLATTAAATLIATSAFSQSTFDGSFGFAYMDAPDDTFDYQTQIDGSLVYGVTPMIKLQFDLGSTTYEGYGYSEYDYGIHAIYSLNSSTDIGAFYSVGETYEYIGVELAYRSAQYSIEAHIEQEYSVGSSTSDYFTAGVEVGYTFAAMGSMPGGITAYAGVNNNYQNDGTIYLPNMYVGLDVDIWNNLQLNTRAASMDDGDYRYYTIGLTYNFGNGAIFAPRNFASSFPGY